MSDSVMVWFAIAVLLFWSMGAYNRLIRLRSQGIAAFAALDGLFNQYLIMVKTHFPDGGAAHSPGNAAPVQDDASTAWAALAAAADQFNASLKVARTRPLHGPTMGALSTALQALYLSWSRLRDLPSDLAGAALPATFQSQWEHVALQAGIARAEFNRMVTNYNEAINQFPALLLAWLFGFKPAQPL